MRLAIHQLKILLFLADLGIAAVSILLASWLRYGPERFEVWERFFREPNLAVITYAVVWVLVLAGFGAYQPMRLLSPQKERIRIVRATLLFVLIVLGVLTALKLYNISRLFLFIAFAIQLTLTLGSRLSVRVFLGWLRRRGGNVRHVLVVGAGERGHRFARELEASPELGVRVVGFLDDNPAANGHASGNGNGKTHFGAAVREVAATRDTRDGPPLIGSLDRLPALLAEQVVDEVVVALPFDAFDRIRQVVATCEAQGKHVHLLADAMETRIATSRFTEVNGLPLISLMSGPDAPFALAVKRLMDVAGAAALLVLLSPVMPAVIVAIKLTSPGPVIFRQRRIGLNGRPFTMYKFRSMVADAEKRLSVDRELYEQYIANDFKILAEQDPRITPLGRFLRKTSLDELPQLWNVLRGDMSLVGPRPIVPSELDNYDKLRGAYLAMRPGVTGHWQVNGRSETGYPDRVEFDLQYVRNWSFASDLKILAHTIPAVFRQKGAY